MRELLAAIPPVWILGAGALLLLVILFPLVRALAWRIFAFDERLAGILSRKKSAEVRYGRVAETLAPFLDEFPVDVTKPGTSTVFIGQPVDFIHFDPTEGVTFIEVKSGNARLSTVQRQLQELIEDGAVRWESVQIRERGEPTKRRLLRRPHLGTTARRR